MSAPGINERRLWSVSPSAIDTYQKCPRSWYYSYVLRVDRGPTPPHMAKGSAIHLALETYHKTGEVLIEQEHRDAPGIKWPVLEFVQAAIPHIPPPIKDPYWDPWREKGDGGLMLEQQGELSTWTEPDGTYGPALNQYIDMVEAYPDRAMVTDYKTSSSARYFKTPDELSTNTQLICNAKWLFSVSDYSVIKLRHLYLLTSGKRPKAVPVEVEVTREHVETEWQRILGIVREMSAWAKMAPDNADPLPPNTDHCNAYSGCPFKPNCGFDNVSGLVTVRRSNMKEGEKMSLLSDMMARAGAAAKPVSGTVTPANGAAPVTATVAPAAGSILLRKVAPVVSTPAPAAKSSSSPLLSGLLAKKAAPPAELTKVDPPAPALTPETAQAAAVAAGYPETFVPTGIVPPDAPSPISTPEEVAAANPEPEAATPAGEKVKRKRRTKAEMEADRAAEHEEAVKANLLSIHAKNEAQKAANEPKVEEVVETKVAGQTVLTVNAPAMPDVQTAVSPEAIDEVLKETEAERCRRVLSTPDAAFGCGTEVLFIDTMPGKGWPGEQPVDAIEFMHAFNSLASSSAGVADYRLIRYESKGYLATAMKLYLKGLPRSLYVDSKMSGADILLETLVPYVKMIFRGVR